ncbi:MAG TPA: hypothetical protein VKU40_14005, partial [Thermoanaerobaculia bacterium]|nr:hypothetical protein [Thermoanaerobaculia bacterium]
MPSTRRLAPFALAVLAVLLVATTAAAIDPSVCTSTAQTLRLACGFEAHDDHLGAVAVCQNISDRDERRDCLAEAKEEARDARGECAEILEGRRDLCDAVGEAAYEPPFGADHAADFVDPLEIGGTVTPNPYFPLV